MLLATFAAVLHADERRVDYNRDIRPILSNTCYTCHGPDAPQRKSGLRLDTREGALQKLESGSTPLVPGKLAESEIYQRLISTDPNEKMPPDGSGKSITPQQIELIKLWIEQGADWRDHWSFVAPVRPEVPKLPAEAGCRNAIDFFVRTQLPKVGLAAAPEADKPTLIRRVTFDLTGLPPTIAEIDAFLADTSTDAYEKVVDRLLNSPRFGEHQARYWLDAARYGDTHGMHLDNERSIWPYRDWVVGAYNRNLPFDQFTIEQLAGDLLPNPTLEQKVATGFHRCNVTTGEGGSIDEEFYVRYGVDRVETTGTVWLGLTLGCSNCHSHKYDPITQKDFYSMFAFFNSLTERAMDGNVLTPPPSTRVIAAEEQKRLDELNGQIAAIQQKIAAEVAKTTYVDPGAGTESKPPERADLVWIDDEYPKGGEAVADAGGWQWTTGPDKPVLSGSRASTRTAAGLSQHFIQNAKPGLKVGAADRLFAYVYLDPKNPPKEIMLQWNDGSWEHRAFWGENLIDWGAKESPARVAIGPLPELGKWVRLEIEASKVNLNAGAIINGWAFTQYGGTTYWDKAGMNTLTPQDGMPFESLVAWEGLQKAVKDAAVPQPIEDVIQLPQDKRTPEQKKQLTNYFIENVYSKSKPIFDGLRGEIATVKNQLAEFEKTLPTSLVMEEMPQRKDAFILVRGEYDKKGEKVLPGTPASLPPMSPEAAGQTPTRLSLAKWLVQPNHPLTARVTVNRYWQQYFGTGIVETAEDFGSQGQWPTHPDLLDWLATEFISSGWNVKALHRLIVTSSTYRQSSKATPESYQKDRTNRWLSRGPRFRMDAEVIRDNSLAVSGLLVGKLGGKSVKPYQPGGLWEAIGFTGSNTATFAQDHGEALYRRSLYTFWKRTSPPPALSIFDAPSREACVVRRARTNTPMHALVLLNDVQHVEASRAFGQRIVKEGGATPESRATFAFRLVTARAPQPAELAVLLKAFQEQLREYKQDKAAALKVIAVGEAPRDESLDPAEHAAWSVIASLLLNLSETVTKG